MDIALSVEEDRFRDEIPTLFSEIHPEHVTEKMSVCTYYDEGPDYLAAGLAARRVAQDQPSARTVHITFAPPIIGTKHVTVGAVGQIRLDQMPFSVGKIASIAS